MSLGVSNISKIAAPSPRQIATILSPNFSFLFFKSLRNTVFVLMPKYHALIMPKASNK